MLLSTGLAPQFWTIVASHLLGASWVVDKGIVNEPESLQYPPLALSS